MVDLTRERPVSVKKAAELFDVHERTIQNWFKCGLDYTKLGRRVFTSLEAFQRFSHPSTAAADGSGRGSSSDSARELELRYGV